MEVLIQTGGFDHLDKNRATLALNYERVIAYENKKKSGSESGQASLFEDAGIQEFVDYKFDEIEEYPKMEMLNMEKQLIGCYVSGHPLDEWRDVIEKSVTLTSQNFEQAAKEDKAHKDALAASGVSPWKAKYTGRTYITVGMIQELRTINTKKGDAMAFAKLTDYSGQFDVTFFPKVWEQLKDKIITDGIYAFKGKVDGSRENGSFLVDSLENPEELKEKTFSKVHIQLENGLEDEKKLRPLCDFLFGEQGTCSVYFHMDAKGIPYVVKANAQLSVPATKEFLQQLKDIPLVSDAWIE